MLCGRCSPQRHRDSLRHRDHLRQLAAFQTSSAKIGGSKTSNYLSIFIGRIVMNPDRILTRSLQIKSGLLAVVLVVSVMGCKARATNPALNFAPVPDGAPQNSYADLVSKVAPAVVTIRADKRVKNAQQFPFSDDPFFRGLFGDRPQQPQETLQ